MAERKVKVQSVNDHDFDTEKLVTGVVVDKGEMEVEPGRKADFINIATDHGIHRVWRAYDLNAVFECVTKGDHVEIEFLGMIPTKTQGRRMREFRYSVWTE